MKAVSLMKKEFFVLLIVILASPTLALSSRRDLQHVSRRQKVQLATCGTCSGRPVIRAVACHPANYLDPTVRSNYQSALRDLRRSGVRPKVTSMWRSTSHQASLHRCSNNRKCRLRHPGLYGAKAPGTSAHEAGFAVDIGGIASGRRGAKRLTPQGRKIVRAMEKNGFAWRYGLKDPAHFEANPRRHGYRNLTQAIRYTQSRCSARVGKRRA
jgi:hypothetical protein